MGSGLLTAALEVGPGIDELSQLGLQGSELGLALEAKLEEEADEEGPRGEGEVEDPLGWEAR